MKRLLKTLRIIILVVLILILAVLILIDLFAERAVKIGIETAATKTLNVGVTVDDVDLSITAGKLGLKKLLINNPPGYKHEKMLELKDAKIQVDIRSLLSDTVKIKEIMLDGANVVLEQRGLTNNNIQDVIKSIPAKEAEPSGKKLHIDYLEITNTKVRVKLLPIPGKADTLTLELSPIKMTNLGGDNKLNTAALSGKILLAIASEIAEQGAGTLPKEMIGSLASELKRLGALSDALRQEGGKLLETGKDIGKEAVETGKDIGEAATEALKGLLKPKKKE